MLKHLTIRNYALIKHLEMDPSANLNVITGETGAGKSIMLGAIGLLMGNRADTKVLWDENEKCITEGTFDIKNENLKSIFADEDLDYDSTTVIRREISPGGKSRAFINDTPVTLEVMKRIGNFLMDVHSQHETLQLGQQTFQLKLVDAYAENRNLIEEYAAAWSNYLKAKKAFESLTSEAETLRQESDYVRFQLDELVKANLEGAEQETLESELKIMEHAGEIKTRFQQAIELLNDSEYAALNSLREARNHLQIVTSFSTRYEEVYKRIDSLMIELDDLVSEIEREGDEVEFDPERTETIKERLSLLYRLLKKHRVQNVKELITIQETLQQKDSLTSNLDEALAASKKTFDQTQQQVKIIAAKLSESRKKGFQPLCKQISKLLHELGMPNAVFEIDSKITEPSPTGIDRIEILFSANKGISPRPLAQVASGGEFSRVMFSIKYVMASKTAMPTLILDEIDNGISGEVAIKLGNLMKGMSKKHQIISISHLPQIAAKGDAHYFVYKDNSAAKTVSSIKRLTNDERVEEIAKMIGGSKPSKVALENAQELLTN
ncbi:DNA repair protein RecN [Chryseolinea sp. H1M3-3]|uniref:DNA repair protein RecN n=1 Tax=Chryseolinea sp. H1M3-3 TaxID=3034144 RepID=UPI0023EB54E3|nr:DNA repair protein RecN [Chryseolinea sp. H1M3-3]